MAAVTATPSSASDFCQYAISFGSELPDYPKLGGQYPDYMAKALRDYKSGARKNAIMLGFAQGLTRQDIDNVAAYYASQPAVLVTKH